MSCCLQAAAAAAAAAAARAADDSSVAASVSRKRRLDPTADDVILVFTLSPSVLNSNSDSTLCLKKSSHL